MNLQRRWVRVEGIVQGVGFRPFVYGLATRLGLSGQVLNDSEGVLIDIEGGAGAVAAFLAALEVQAPPLAHITQVVVTAPAPTGHIGFCIAESQSGSVKNTLVSADVATCEACLRELFDPADRRFRYPFINCTHCGPRYTITRDVPYDRPNTTMAGFPMCGPCAREYHDPTNRRFHAQPIACATCGPQVQLQDSDQDPLSAAVERLLAGQILAVKGLGGYHLACLARDEEAVARLRARKHREEKPFAVMVTDIDMARTLCPLDEAAGALLASPSRPVVLLPRRAGTVAPSVAPGNTCIGLMLPYTPLHHLLLRQCNEPLVMTSGNLSDEPVAYQDAAALERLRPIYDAFLTHNRPIHIRTDDSVVRSLQGLPVMLRRSRGYVPRPITVSQPFRKPVLGCGAELKSTVCLGRDRHAFLSHHLGDLENHEVYQSFQEAIRHLQGLFDVRPQRVAHDLHPDYLSTRWAREQDDVELVGVQHHHAHIVSCMADNGWSDPVIGVAFDGLGYGTDGTMWGGEFLLADARAFERAAHLRPVPMPGGAQAVLKPWRMAAAYLAAAFGTEIPELDVAARQGAGWQVMLRMAGCGFNSPLTSSMGRLFDAVASVLGIRDAISYEGQAAIEMEQQTGDDDQSYPIEWDGGVADGAALLRKVVEDLLNGLPAPRISARFHHAVADLVVGGCERLRVQSGFNTVALSGGVFQNVRLLQAAQERLVKTGFGVLVHRQVPTNDGGISLGQAVIAGQRP